MPGSLQSTLRSRISSPFLEPVLPRPLPTREPRQRLVSLNGRQGYPHAVTPLARLAADAERCRACELWLAADAVVVALGATAGQSLLGPAFRVGTSRGKQLTLGSRRLVATIHPSAVLRGLDAERAELFDGLVTDLRQAAALAP